MTKSNSRPDQNLLGAQPGGVAAVIPMNPHIQAGLSVAGGRAARTGFLPAGLVGA